MSKRFKFYTPVKVRFNETDRLGHVNFGHYYFYFDVAVEAYMTAIGYDYQTMQAENVEFVYVESHCNYKAEANWPETLLIYARIGHIGNRSLRFDFEVTSQSDERLVATGHIVAVTVDGISFKPHPVPDGFRRAVATYEDETSPRQPM